MRIVIKGGVWKNSEDEILKAAVMKYGLNQWARVASLLPRKTAKQCKARWYEWLDPTIKKTEWTREEEERLLHLAKLMPAQWRTIAPLVGRTAAQCLEHYEKLLDAAQAKDGVAIDARDDPRKLRPGEIDPHPEVKPARPDPVDMDDDEKEMLSEARARLANTKGKKAKRIAREKMLEDAKRIASLQKLRELKAAGVDIAKRRRKRSEGIDYAKEIPFEMSAPAGYYDTATDDTRRMLERAAETDGFKMTLLNKIERERAAEIEARERKADKTRMKRMMQKDLPAMLAAEVEKDPLSVHKRTRLALPAPVLSDAELEEAVKLGAHGTFSEDYDDSGDAYDNNASVVTSALLGDYKSSTGTDAVLAARHAALGAGVPTSVMRRNAIMEEARNLAALNSMQTPLLGGDNVDLEEGTGFSGATPLPRRAPPTAGHALALSDTPMRAGLGLPAPRSSSAASVAGSVAQPGAPTFRDQMGLNDDETFSVSASEFGGAQSVSGMTFGARSVASKQISESVSLALSSLPAPKFAYDIVAPQLPTSDVDMSHGPSRGTSEDVMDQGELDERLRQLEEEHRAKELERRSSVLKHVPALPRPLIIDEEAVAPPAGTLERALKESGLDVQHDLVLAESLVRDEVLALLKADAVQYPVSHVAFKKPKRAPILDSFDDEELAAARAQVAEETALMKLSAEIECGQDVSFHAVNGLLDDMSGSTVYVPGKFALIKESKLDAAEDLNHFRLEFRRLQRVFESEQARLSKAESRFSVLTKGFEMRSRNHAAASVASASEELNKVIEYSCFVRLAHDETEALPLRLDSAQRELDDAVEKEKVLQQRYRDLLSDISDMKTRLQSAGIQV